ncbi:MAG: type II toxin-antitoxin system VapC family toxin [Elusimicrobia bacterium]|nr:type II toxin-antitoxin system VapC family toxin [Elusimicrobiota bacterium]
MSARKVLDSYGLIAFFENEPGADRVADLIKEARDKDKPLFLSVVNWGEVYYIVSRTAGKAAAEETIKNLDTLPIEIVGVDRAMTKLAAEFKASRKMSYADCFAAALAKNKKAELITGDKEFKEVEGDIKIVWV